MISQANIQSFYVATKEFKKNTILAESNYSYQNDEIQQSKAISSYINTFFTLYIAEKQNIFYKELNKKKQINQSITAINIIEQAISQEFSQFYSIAQQSINIAFDEANSDRASNLFSMAGATNLVVSNKIIRSLNAKMGLLWERLAICSLNAISPETEFGIKIKGVDLIVQNPITRKIEYVQLKTQKNTLTGSQATRVINELTVHSNPILAACFDLSNWTFPNGTSVEKIAGKELWDDRLGISYQLVCESVSKFILHCENYINSM